MIGIGRYSKIWRIVNMHTNEKYAAKIFNSDAKENHAELIQNEVNLIKQLNSVYLVRHIEIFEDHNCFAIVMEKLNGGNLL